MILSLSDLTLLIANPFVILGLLVTGCTLNNKEKFLQLTCLMSFSLIINVTLKYFFKVPLPPHLNSLYAFPSGHMQNATVFYGWLACTYPSILWKILCPFLLLMLGYGLYDHHYHSILDLAGGVITGMSLIVFDSMLLYHAKKERECYLLAVASLLVLFNIETTQLLPAQMWCGYGFLLGYALRTDQITKIPK